MKNMFRDINRLLSLVFVFGAVMFLLVPPTSNVIAQVDPSIEQCRDVLLNFDDLPHGARLGNPDGSEEQTINWQLAPYGIEASAIANNPNDPPGRGLDTLIVYDSHFGPDSGDPDNFDNTGLDPHNEHPFNLDDPALEGTPIIPTSSEICDEKLSVLTMKYTGNDNPTSHSQPDDKVNIEGDNPTTDPVFIIVSSKENLNDNKARIYFTGTVDLGATFEIDSNNADRTKLDNTLFVSIFSDESQTTLLQFIEFHTSCSVPLFLGDQFGSVLVVGFLDENGVGNDPNNPFASPNDWKNGGTVTYTLEHERVLKKFTGVDDHDTVNSIAKVFLSDNTVITIPIDQNLVDRGTHVYDIEDISGVIKIEFFYISDGGITNIEFGCVQDNPCENVSAPDAPEDGEVINFACIKPSQSSSPQSTETNKLIMKSGALPADGSIDEENNTILDTEEPEGMPPIEKQGELPTKSNFLQVPLMGTYFDDKEMNGKMGKDIAAKLEQEDIKIDKRLKSLLKKVDDEKYFGKISKKDNEPKSYSIYLEGTASSISDSTITDFTGKFNIESLATSKKSAAFIVSSGQLIIQGEPYDLLFGKAIMKYSDKNNSVLVLAEILNPEGDVNTLRLSFNLNAFPQENLSEPVNFEISKKSKLAHNWNLDASGEFS